MVNPHTGGEEYTNKYRVVTRSEITNRIRLVHCGKK